ncbi:methyltransferase family protein [Natrinema gelatinilyticum]|uniref:methyltransferase family protein n=1 Tax=Natrinema gelatinilyticum TaxID=2961571 RepID=UPI0020C27AA7|nr:isoprenylcysteine carboxylmethyltransferase family protein [Natrinema gelatinilyticum]
MSEGQRGGWQWADVPVPEPHVAGLLVGGGIHYLVPVRATANQRLAKAVGWPLIGTGLLIIGWAVRTIGDPNGRQLTGLVTTGPYAFTRNPMYVGWFALYLGLALVLNIAWLFVVFPAVVVSCHRVVRREERTLEHDFGDEYRSYRRKVRRYL